MTKFLRNFNDWMLLYAIFTLGCISITIGGIGLSPKPESLLAVITSLTAIISVISGLIIVLWLFLLVIWNRGPITRG